MNGLRTLAEFDNVSTFPVATAIYLIKRTTWSYEDGSCP